MPANALEVLGERFYLGFVHDAGCIRAGGDREFSFLLDAPAEDRFETRRLQEHEGVEPCEHVGIIRAQALVDIVAPTSVRIPVGLEFIDGLLELGLWLRDAADTPALQDNQVDRSGDGGP